MRARSLPRLLAAAGTTAVAALLAVTATGLHACGDSGNGGDFGVQLDLSAVGAVVLAPASTLTSCLAVDDQNVYWTDDANGGAVLAVPKNGGVVKTLFTGAVDRRSCIAVDATSVYFTTDGTQTIRKVPIGGGTAQVLYSGQHVIGRLVVADNALWWGTDVYGAVDQYNGMNAIVRAPIGGGTMPSVEYGQVMGDVSGLAVTTQTLFISDASGIYAVSRGSMQKGATFGMSTFRNNTFDSDDMHLVMAEVTGFNQGNIVLYNLDGSGRKVLSMTLASSLTLDSTGVYAKLDNQMVKFHLTGGAPVVVSDVAPRAIALDATSIFFTDGSSILKLPKTND